MLFARDTDRKQRGNDGNGTLFLVQRLQVYSCNRLRGRGEFSIIATGSTGGVGFIVHKLSVPLHTA